MQDIEIWVLKDVEELTGQSSCLDDTYNPICKKIQSAESQAGINLNIEAFALPARNEGVKPIADHWQLKNFPALIFVDTVSQRSFFALDGNITTRKIKKVLEMLPDYEYSGSGNSYLNGDGETVDITEDLQSRAGGLVGGSWGLPIGASWGKCEDYLPGVMCKTPKWVYILLIAIILLLVYKIIK